MHPGPMVRLNLIIAQSRMLGAGLGLKALENMSEEDRKRLRPWWDCAIADAFEQLHRPAEAIAHLTDALALSANAAQQRLIEQKLARLQSRL
jgi:predicted RNA polymerase sigma factor